MRGASCANSSSSPSTDRPLKKRKGAPDEPEGKRKKARTTFTGHQIFELERQFEIKKYLGSAERTEMAKLLDVTETQVCGETVLSVQVPVTVRCFPSR